MANDRLDTGHAVEAFEAVFGDGLEEHPSEEDLAALADGSAVRSMDRSRRAELESHLEHCAVCTADVEDLRSWIAESKPRARAWSPWLAAAAAITVVVVLIGRRDDPGPPPRGVVRPRAVTPAPVPVPSATPAVPERGTPWDPIVAGVRRTGVLPLPADLRELATTDRFRGDSQTAVQGEVEPSATAIDETRPQFRWPNVAGATYSVVVIEAEGGREVTTSPRIPEAQWTCDVALKRGTTYRWQVVAEGEGGTAIMPAPPAPPAIFRVLRADEHAQIAEVARRAAGDHLLLGVMHAKFGLIADARRELSEYAARSKDPLAQKLLAQLPRANPR